MGKAPAFQRYAGDYLADERLMLMTLEEEGAYNRAQALCWREGSIPADETLLSRLLKNASLDIVRVVQRCFVPSPNDPSRLIDLELEEQREKRRLWIAKSSEAGRKSGKARRTKGFHAEPTFNDGSGLVEPNPNSSSSSSSSLDIPLQAALRILKELEIHASERELPIVAEVIEKELGRKGGFQAAMSFLKDKAKLARAAGVPVNFFWLKDEKYNAADLIDGPGARVRRRHRESLPQPSSQFTPTSEADAEAEERQSYFDWLSTSETYKRDNPWKGRVFA